MIQNGGNIPEAFKGRRITTIGRWNQTQTAATRGARILDDPVWTIDKNAEWIHEAIKNGDVIELVSDVNISNLDSRLYEATAYARELDALLQAGYTRVDNYLIPIN